ncbi:MAG: S9 family peptidase [Flavobacteriales bacterium]|jgi:oligopeptidase B|nr:S9 family peptidase [Flavobacteriales bacterium]
MEFPIRHVPPIATQKVKAITVHGHTRHDAYYWMRLTEIQRVTVPHDEHTQEVIAHLAAENAYSEAVLAPVAGLREKLYEEIKGRIKETDLSVPYRENGYWYHHRYEEGKEYPVHVRRKDEPDAVPEDILNENILAADSAYFDLADYEIDPTNTIIGYSVDTVGRRQYELRFRDLSTGKELADIIPDTGGGCAFANEHTVFYARQDETLRSYRIYKHILGSDPGSDVLVYEEKDVTFSCDIYRSRSDQFMIINTDSSFSSEHLILPVDEPEGTFKVFLPREEEHEHSIIHVPGTAPEEAGKWYIMTNWNATNFRLMECAETDTHDKTKWKEVLPHDPNVLLEDVDVFKDHLVFSERSEGLPHILVRRISDGHEHEIAFNDPAYVCYTGINAEWNSDQLRFGYTSLTTPSGVYLHDLNTTKDTLLKQQEVVGDFDAANYKSERIWVTARDGVKVPVSLVHRIGTSLDGTAPLLLYGYGSYGHSIDPVFGSARLSLLDRGFVFAIAHVRGGEELGRAWYDNGRLEYKLNTFTDFIDCAVALVDRKYADPERLFAWGGSAGGLLVGAVLNMRPDLWKAVVAEVPFVDVVTTMLDDTIPLTTGEYEEWGDPNEKEAYERMLSYSPYDNVKDAEYPAVLVITGLHDSQVQYWEPAKWVQRLRTHQKGEAPILLHTDLEAGHGGATGRFESLKETALIYAFLIEQAGLNNT